MNEGREPNPLLWWWRCELQQVYIDKVAIHPHEGEEGQKIHTRTLSRNLPVSKLTCAIRYSFWPDYTNELCVKCAHYTYTQIHTLEPNPLNLLANTVKAEEKRPVQDNDLRIMSIHLSCCHKHFHTQNVCALQQTTVWTRYTLLLLFSFIWPFTAVHKRKQKNENTLSILFSLAVS